MHAGYAKHLLNEDESRTAEHGVPVAANLVCTVAFKGIPLFTQGKANFVVLVSNPYAMHAGVVEQLLNGVESRTAERNVAPAAELAPAAAATDISANEPSIRPTFLPWFRVCMLCVLHC